MRKLVFATNNAHKLHEIKTLLNLNFEIVSLKELSFHEEIPETHPTLEGNAKQKAAFIFDRFGMDCFADDTGLEIEALGGEPGVYSARYAGENCSFQDNVDKVLSQMKNIRNRKACFRTVICLIENGETRFFEGRVDGHIADAPIGSGGFGYDPLFIPAGFKTSFAEMAMEQKNKISHRGLATRQLADYLIGKA